MLKKQVFLCILFFLIGILLSVVVSAACSTLNSNYTLSANESAAGDCFTIGANSITLNCAGYAINGANTGTGIKMDGQSNIIIKNCDINNFTTGINVSNSHNIFVNNTNISYVTTGIFIDPSDGTTTKTNVKSFNTAVHMSQGTWTFDDVTANSGNIGLLIDGGSIGTQVTQSEFTGNTLDVQNLGLDSTFTDVRCISGINVECREEVPFFGDFSGTTTDFTNPLAVPDLSNVIGATLADTTGNKIVWSMGVDARNVNLNDNVLIGNGFASLNPAGLNPTWNMPATITLKNVDCNNYVIYTKSGFPASANAIINDRTVCTSCTVDSCVGSTLTFTVAGFSGYASGPGTNLTIWDDTDTQTKYTNQQVIFYANYTNATSGAIITGANCNITFQVVPAGPFTMAYNAGSTLYEYNRTFSSTGPSNWNVNCSAAGYATLGATDTVTISATGSVPEFSTYAMLLALMIVISGFFIYRNKL